MSSFIDINNKIDLLSYPSIYSFSNSIDTNLVSPLNNYPSYNLNIIEIFPSPINSYHEEESLNINKIPNINNNIINPNLSKSTNTSNNNSRKIFSIINPKKSKLIDRKNNHYIKREKNKNSNRKTHTGFDDDNVLRKIQIHFINFIISFCNDITRNLITEKKIPKFQDIDHQFKKYVNHQKIEWFKSLTLGDIIQLQLSPKIKRHDINVNINIYKKFK